MKPDIRMKMPEYDIIGLTPCTGAWTVEMTMETGVVWRTPVVGWAITRDDHDDPGTGTGIEPVIVHIDQYLTMPLRGERGQAGRTQGPQSLLTFYGMSEAKGRLLFNGEDPWVRVTGPSDPDKGVNEDV